MSEQKISIADYISRINKIYARGGATEHTYRSELADLIQSLCNDVEVTNEPRRIECGAPDYIVQKGAIPVGYIEAKDINLSLDNVENDTSPDSQMQRYVNGLDNLILTDYLEFRFYQYGKKTESVRIAQIKEKKVIPLYQHYDHLERLLKDFSNFHGHTIKRSGQLAKMMADKAKLMREVFYKALTQKDADGDSSLQLQLSAFRKILIADLDEKTFADIYAQTIAYGLFAARLYHNEKEVFSREKAMYLIPKSNPFLRKLFSYVAGVELDERVVWIVDALADIFRYADTKEAKHHHVSEDEFMIHFYETFLAEYDPSLREKRGVYYTPLPIVQFMVRAVDDILKTEFKIRQGLADISKVKVPCGKTVKEVHKVQILDPATGTGTFLTEIMRQIQQRFKGQAGLWESYVEEHIKPRLHGFEILMASYAMCHLKLDLLLQKTGYRSDKNENSKRFHIFLTNALEDREFYEGELFASWLAQEANEASAVKKDAPVMIVIGNPPYSGESANVELIHDKRKLLDDYKREPGGKEPLQERNAKWINDDYVKFIRYGQFLIEKNGEGIVAYISNHSFLDNPTFRGMRWHLLQEFDRIYIIDLHGNSRKKELSPEGLPDKNVFNIQQGVSINLFVKTKRKKKNELARIWHSDLYGLREGKFQALQKNTLKKIGLQELSPQAPHYFFVPKDLRLLRKYEKGFAVNECFPLYSVGIVTARDRFTIHDSREQVKQSIQKFLESDDETARAEFDLGKDARDWKVSLARKDLLRDKGPNFNKITEMNYRPFDTRYTYYTGHSRGFHCKPRGAVMRHFIDLENVGLVTIRRSRKSENWREIFVSDTVISGATCISALDINYLFPLYRYPETKNGEQNGMFEKRQPNLNKEIVAEFSKKLALKFRSEKQGGRSSFAPIDILDYIYAVLHSPSYRRRYAEFLRIDFPRLPYPRSKEEFFAFAKLGQQLRKIHLLRSRKVEKLQTKFPQKGTNEVSQITYEKTDANKGKVYINKAQFFSGVPNIAWNLYIGGYQPAQKWLSDRKGRSLSAEDILHYQKMIAALCQTHDLMQQISNMRKF